MTATPLGVARAELRRATADIHEELHRHPGFVKLMQGRLTVPEYTRLLARLFGFHQPLESALCAASIHAAGKLDLRSREKAHLLRDDLTVVGMSQPEIDALPLCPHLPHIRSYEDLMGCLYVVEGAALGGSIMARRLDGLLGADSAAGRRFFLGRPDPDPLPWRAYCRLLEACAANGDFARIAASARRTFNATANWLGECHV